MDQELIAELKQEYLSLKSRLEDPNSISGAEYGTISARFAQLTPIYELISRLDSIELNTSNNNELISTEQDVDLVEMAKEENALLLEEKEQIESSLKEELKKSDPNDIRNSIIEIRAGSGGEESALFAGDLLRMYTRYAEGKGWKLTTLSSNRTGNGGYKEIIFIIEGNGVYGQLKFENGVHRVQRIPATESSGRIHTSAVSVVVLPEVDDVNVEIDENDLKIDVYRSSGPGGQSVNTTDSAVRITHVPSGIVVTCQDEKSQHKNKARALSILKSKLFEIEQEKQSKELSDARKSAIQSGDRSAKIRTYNYPQSRVTDHRIKVSWHNLSGIMDGDLEELLENTIKDLSI